MGKIKQIKKESREMLCQIWTESGGKVIDIKGKKQLVIKPKFLGKFLDNSLEYIFNNSGCSKELDETLDKLGMPNKASQDELAKEIPEYTTEVSPLVKPRNKKEKKQKRKRNFDSDTFASNVLPDPNREIHQKSEG